MSTKTTFKRVALVTVAVMGFGLLSVVPSSATTQGDTLTLTDATTAGTLNTAATNTLTQSFLGTNGDTMTVTASMVSYPTGSVAVPVLTATAESHVKASASVSGLVGTMMETSTPGVYAQATGVYALSFTPTLVGTYVMKFTPQTNPTTQGATAAAVTWTVTVAAALTSSATTSTSILALGTASAGSADVVVNVAKAVKTTPAATIYVTPLTSTGSNVSIAEKLTVSISGPGTAGIGASTSAASTGKDFSAGSAGWYTVSVWADGTSGASTITIKSGTVTLGSETVTFIGDPASVVATLVKPVIAAGSTGVAGVITAIAKDSSGTVVSGATLYAVAAGSGIATATAVTDSVGKATFTLVGKIAGTHSVTVQSYSTGSAATTDFSSAAVSVRVGSDVVSAVTMTLDKATYSQGEAAVLTVTLKDAAGSLVTDATHAAFSADVTSTRATTGDLPKATGVVTSGSANGSVTYKFNVPTTSGAFTISGLGGANLAAAQAGLAISVTATVSQSAAEIANADAIAAAADAAAEATDAANAATDAANAAAEAADAATAAAQDAADAVATLGTQVAELVADLKAQIAAQKAAITALTNLVIKIQKKLKA